MSEVNTKSSLSESSSVISPEYKKTKYEFDHR